MVRQWLYQIQLLMQRLSLRCGGFALLAIISSLIAVKFAIFVPPHIAKLAGGFAVDRILGVMASSMLVVVTFSLSTMVAAYSSANQNSTPRATNLIINDSKFQGAISIFLGAFIYSVVSLIALSTNYYGKEGRVILLGMTIAVLTSVVIVIIRWVEELKNMGSTHESIRKVEVATLKSLENRAIEPTFSCRLFESLPSNAEAVLSPFVGHIQNIDVLSLAKISDQNEIKIYLVNDVGAFLDFHTPLFYVETSVEIQENILKKIYSAFAVASDRTFQNDPRYGLNVLAGIGLKALSPSLNDPGTAVDVIGTLVRVLTSWHRRNEENDKAPVKYDRLYFPRLKNSDLFNEAFFGLVSTGVHHIAVVNSLQNAFQILSRYENFREASHEHLKILQTRSDIEYTLRPDLERIHVHTSPVNQQTL